MVRIECKVLKIFLTENFIGLYVYVFCFLFILPWSGIYFVSRDRVQERISKQEQTEAPTQTLTFCHSDSLDAKLEHAATNQQLPSCPWCKSCALMPSTKRWGSSHSSCTNPNDKSRGGLLVRFSEGDKEWALSWLRKNDMCTGHESVTDAASWIKVWPSVAARPHYHILSECWTTAFIPIFCHWAEWEKLQCKLKGISWRRYEVVLQ